MEHIAGFGQHSYIIMADPSIEELPSYSYLLEAHLVHRLHTEAVIIFHANLYSEEGLGHLILRFILLF